MRHLHHLELASGRVELDQLTILDGPAPLTAIAQWSHVVRAFIDAYRDSSTAVLSPLALHPSIAVPAALSIAVAVEHDATVQPVAIELVPRAGGAVDAVLLRDAAGWLDVDLVTAAARIRVDHAPPLTDDALRAACLAVPGRHAGDHRWLAIADHLHQHFGVALDRDRLTIPADPAARATLRLLLAVWSCEGGVVLIDGLATDLAFVHELIAETRTQIIATR